MLYITENRLFFRTDDGALWIKGGEDNRIILSPIVSRLLHLFLKERGKILTREEIMTQVWEDHGLEPSNNSLNQYVSQIRKIMIAFDFPDDLIRTIPRIGFIYRDEYTVIEQESTSTELTYRLHYSNSASTGRRIITINRVISVCFLMVFIIMPFLIRPFTDNIHHQKLSVIPVLAGHIENCPIYSVLMGRFGERPEILFLAQKYINDNNISCDKDSVIYFFAQNSLLDSHEGRLLLTHCKKKSGGFVSCKDFAYNVLGE